MSLSGTAKLAGIIGWPVSQSFSPLLHGYWLNEMASTARSFRCLCAPKISRS